MQLPQYDYSYLNDLDKRDDSRWVHRLRMDWSILKKNQAGSYQQRINEELKTLFTLRKRLTALSSSTIELLPIACSSILAYRRWNQSNYLLVIANFSEHDQTVDLKPLGTLGLGHFFKDLISETTLSSKEKFILNPYQFLWLTKN